MSSSTNPPRSADQEDPWEQLAEDLFGLEFGKEHASREPAPEAAEPIAPRAPAAPSVPIRSSEEFVLDVSAPEEEIPRFAAAEESEATLEESDEPEVVNQPLASDNEPFAEGAAPPEPSSATPTSPQDSYWDALANWNWNESEGSKSRTEHRRADQQRSEGPRSDRGRSGGGPPPRGGSRGRGDDRGRRGGDRPTRESGSSPPSPASPPAGRTPPSSESDDFGLGLASEAPGFSPPAEAPRGRQQTTGSIHDEDSSSTGTTPRSSAGPAPARVEGREGQRGGARRGEAGGEGEFPRKRRRRRRRRRGGRGGEGEPDQAPAAQPAVPGEDWDDSAGPEVDLPEDEAEPLVEASGGEPSEDVPPDRSAGENRGRRYGRPYEDRRRRAPAGRGAAGFNEEEGEEPQEIVTAGGGAGEPEPESGTESVDDEAGEEQIVNYEDVPTWEEAISYLLHPNQVQVESGGSGGSSPPRGAPPADQPRQTRHIGHRKHRR